MAELLRAHIPFFVVCLLLGFVVSSLPFAVLAKSGRPISDFEIRERKNACYADIESGLWGWECKSSVIAKENCALRCLSPPCYEFVYESDPLEEGEKDFIRSQEYKYCMHNLFRRLHVGRFYLETNNLVDLHPNRLSMGESLEGIKGSFDY